MQLSPVGAMQVAMMVLAVGAVAALALSSNRKLVGWFSFAVTLVAGALGLWASAATIVNGPAEAVTFGQISMLGSTLRFYMDGLAAVFVGLVSIVAILAAFYSVGYMDHYADYHLARYYPWLLAFVAGMYGILTVTDTMVFFCLFWQLMTIPSFALIRFEYRKPENVKAANRYLLMMQIACVLVMAGSAVIAHSAAPTDHGLALYDFDNLREMLAAQPIAPQMLALALLAMLIGFGIKAGMWPLGQLWLPDAHPAAPSPVSAMLSGVMIKTGIYGLIRTFFWLVPETDTSGFSPALWGGLLAVVGTITLVLGTYQALKQEQTKRLLAFHSIGQVGYIILGLGACLMLAGSGQTAAALATIAMIGALFHTINHALFKSLLFFNAGTVLKATHTQDLNKLGGLVSVMPLTAMTCMVASFSIAGVPLFNGFASKWSIYTATILSGPHAGLLVLCGLFGILTSALTLASFMKFFGLTFLSRRSTIVNKQSAAGVRMEAGAMMQIPQVLLALACIALGIVPALGYLVIDSALAHGVEGISQLLSPVALSATNMTTGIAPSAGAALLMPLALLAVISALLALAWFISRLGAAPRRTADVWLCGYDREADIHRYGAHNLYGEVKHLFSRKHR